MVNATLTFQMVAVLASDGQWDERRCDQQSQGDLTLQSDHDKLIAFLWIDRNISMFDLF